MRLAMLIAGWAFASFIAAAPAAPEEVVVIVNKSNMAVIDRAFVASVYLGKTKSWAEGKAIAACDLPEDDAVRVRFTHDFLGKTVANMTAMWAQFTFSGRAVPPRQLASDEEVKRAVSANPHAIGYIRASSLDNSVRAALH